MDRTRIGRTCLQTAHGRPPTLLESADVHAHQRRSRWPRRLKRPARFDRMDRAHRRRAHRSRVRDAGSAAAARRARHRGRPVGDGPARAFGTPRHRRTGAPCPRTRRWPGTCGMPPRIASHRRCAITPIALTLGRPPSPHGAGSRLPRVAGPRRNVPLHRASSPVPHVDFPLAQRGAGARVRDRHGVPVDSREVGPTRSPCITAPVSAWSRAPRPSHVRRRGG